MLREKYPSSKIIKMKLDAAVKKAESRQSKRSNHLCLSDCTYHRNGSYLPTRKEDMWR